MIVQVRRKMVEIADQNPVPSAQDVFEWCPTHGCWYTVHRDRIFFKTKNGNTAHKNELIQHFFNALYGGLMVTVEAIYFRNTRQLHCTL